MKTNEFDALAERVLLALVGTSPETTAHFVANHAIKIADEFVKALNRRHLEFAAKNGVLLPEEIALLRAQPHPRVIDVIKAVRDRTGLDLKSAKDLVDKTRREMGQLD